MLPLYDSVQLLLETPFSRWKDEDQKDLLKHGSPQHSINLNIVKQKKNYSYKIHFKCSWFETYKWLCSSLVSEKVYCWPCLLFSQKKSVFNKEGFSDFMNITRSLTKHGDSAEHLQCDKKLRVYERNQNTIKDALEENSRIAKQAYNNNVRLNREVLNYVVDTVLFLSKQELSFRGHDESQESSNRGNFKELLSMFIKKSPIEVQNHYQKVKTIFSGDSKTVQNELIQCIADCIDRFVSDEIHDVPFYSIQVDETTDIRQVAQCSIILRYVNNKGLLVERFLGFHNVSQGKTSESLFELLNNVLKNFKYEEKLVGQCYDGASVMAGHLNGLQKKVQDKAPLALFVHCLAHRLNLVLLQCLKNISPCRIFFKTLSGIPAFFHNSCKRTNSLGPLRIPTVAETRWSSNSKLLRVLTNEWTHLKETFEKIIDDQTSDNNSIQMAKGYLSDFQDFNFTFIAHVYNEIFCTTDILFDTLQKKSLDINFCISQIERVKILFKDKRSDSSFESLFEKSKKITDVDYSKRMYKNMSAEQIKTKFRALYFEIVDSIIMEMDVRFQDLKKLMFVSLVDSTKFSEFSKNFPERSLEMFQAVYGKLFKNIPRLKNELEMIYMDKEFHDSDLLEIITLLHKDRDLYVEAYKLFCLVATIPSTSVSVERSFSCLKRLKTYLRNSMTHERLSALANISIQKDVIQELLKGPFHSNIIDLYAQAKDRRINLIYKT